MEQLTAFVSRFDGEKVNSAETVEGNSTISPKQQSESIPVMSSSPPHAFNIASILSGGNRSRYIGDIRNELAPSTVATTSKSSTQLESACQFLV